MCVIDRQGHIYTFGDMGNQIAITLIVFCLVGNEGKKAVFQMEAGGLPNFSAASSSCIMNLIFKEKYFIL